MNALSAPPEAEPANAPRATRVSIGALARQRPSAVLGFVVLVSFAVIAVIAPLIEPYPLREQMGRVYGPPSSTHWLGLDDGGFDVLSRLIEGTRASMLVGFAAAFITLCIGGVIGVAAGYFGGPIDTILMRVTDYMIALPGFAFLVVIAGLFGGRSLTSTILLLGLVLWTVTARIIRSQVKSIRERAYVLRVRSMGAGNLRIVFKHILPHLAPLLVAQTVLTVSAAIYAETGLSFLGLGDPSIITWGSMIQNAYARSVVTSGAWWAIVPPGLCVAVVVMSCSLVGQAVEDALDPRLKTPHLSVRGFRVRRRIVPVDNG